MVYKVVRQHVQSLLRRDCINVRSLEREAAGPEGNCARHLGGEAGPAGDFARRLDREAGPDGASAKRLEREACLEVLGGEGGRYPVSVGKAG